jgi:mono/diheme cytochrome c family protein
MRCVSCHGASGKGDGPIAESIGPNNPGNQAAGEFQHGDRPEQVLAVIRDGVSGTNMAGWRDVFDEGQRRALAAYVYHLAGKEVPEVLRGGGEGEGAG